MRLLLLSWLLLLAGRCSAARFLRRSEAQQGVQGARQGVQGAQQGFHGARQGVQGARQGVQGAQQGFHGARQGVQGARQAVQGAQQGFHGARQGVQGARQGVQGLSDGRSALQLGRGSRTRVEDGGALSRARSPQGPEGKKERFLKHLTGPLHFNPKCRKHFHRLYHNTRDCTIPAYYKRCARLLTRLANSPRCKDR